MSDYTVGDTIYHKFTTRAFADGAPTTLAGTPSLEVYEDGGTTPLGYSVPLTVDVNSRTGLNGVTIVATGANSFEVDKFYQVVIAAGTVDSVSVVGEVVWEFSLGASAAAQTLAGTADVNVTEIGGSAVTATSGVMAVNATQIEGADATNQINAACDTAIADAALATAAALATVDGNVDAILLDTGTDGVVLAANSVSASALATDAVNEIRDAILGFNAEDDPNTTVSEILSILLSFAAGQASGQGTTSPVFLSPAGNENRIVATTDSSANRSAVTLTPAS